MRRRHLLTSLALAPLGAALGCSTGRTDRGGGGRAVISYGIWDQLQVPAMQAVLAEFTAEHPEIEVDLQVTPFTTYWTRLQTSITGGGAPDVFWMNGPNIRKFAAYDTLLPLGERLGAAGEDLSAHPTNLVELYRYRGEQYGVPYPVLMAGSLLASIPMILVYLLLQRQFVQGIALSGSKG